MSAHPTPAPALVLVLLAGVAAGWVTVRHSTGPLARTGADEVSPALAAGNDSVLQRIAVKQQVAAALVRGELSLAEAAAWFRESNGDDLNTILGLRDTYPGADAEELVFRQVLHFVRNDQYSPPDLRAARLPLLIAEFFTMFPNAEAFSDWFRMDCPQGSPSRPSKDDGPPARR